MVGQVDARIHPSRQRHQSQFGHHPDRLTHDRFLKPAMLRSTNDRYLLNRKPFPLGAKRHLNLKGVPFSDCAEIQRLEHCRGSRPAREITYFHAGDDTRGALAYDNAIGSALWH
jgi:hypothetical protein